MKGLQSEPFDTTVPSKIDCEMVYLITLNMTHLQHNRLIDNIHMSKGQKPELCHNEIIRP